MKNKKLLYVASFLIMTYSSTYANDYKSDKEYSYEKSIDLIVDRIMLIEKVLTKRTKVELDEDLVKLVQVNDKKIEKSIDKKIEKSLEAK